MNNVNKRLGIFFSIVAIFLTVLTIVPIQTALAAPPRSTTNVSDNNQDQFIRFLLRKALETCYTGHYIQSNSEGQVSEIQKGNFFDQKYVLQGSALGLGSGVTYAPMLPPIYAILKHLGVNANLNTSQKKAGLIECDSTLINLFIEHHKPNWEKPIDVFCNSGGEAYKKTGWLSTTKLEDCALDGVDFYDAPSRHLKYSALESASSGKTFNLSQNTTVNNGSGWSNLYLDRTFVDSCKLKESTTTAYTQSQPEQGVYKIEEKFFTGEKGDTQFYYYNPSNNWQPASITCAEAIGQVANIRITNPGSGPSESNPSALPIIGDLTGGVGGGNSGEGGDVQSSCNIEGVGWIVCPVVRFLAKITDGAMGFLEKNFLKVEAKLLQGTTQTAWGAVRNIANVLFLIIFLIVIFSQLTGVGISNYGVKTMLPRLVVGAILVNLSFVICQLAVDLSNIVGNGVNDTLSGIATTIQDENLLTAATAAGGIGSGSNKWANLAGGTLAVAGGGLILWASLGALIPMLLGAVLAALGILLMLAARKALIVMLTVISPLAFIAFLFPNKSVNSLFDKWQKIFISLLTLYPIVAFVYSGSKLASNILTDVYVGTASDGTEALDAFNVGQIIAAGVSVLPLFLVPSMLKKSLDGLGKVGATIGGLSGKLQGGAKNAWGNSDLAKNMERNKATDRATVHGGTYQGKNPFNKVRSRANRFINTNTGGYGSRRERIGGDVARKQNAEDVEMADVQLANRNLSLDKIKEIALAQDETGKTGGEGAKNIALRQAAIKSIVASGDVEALADLWDQSLTLDNKDPNTQLVRNALADSLMSSPSRSAGLGAGAVAGLKSGSLNPETDTFSGTIRQAAEKGKFSAEKLVNEDSAMLKKLSEAMSYKDRGAGYVLSVNERKKQIIMKHNVQTQAREAQNNPSTRTKIGDRKGMIDQFASINPLGTS